MAIVPYNSPSSHTMPSRPPRAIRPASPLVPTNYFRRGFHGYEADQGFGNWLSDAARAIIPSKTIVGKLLAGNTQGAIASTVAMTSGKPTTPTVKPLPGAALFAPTGFIAQNQTLLLGGAAALAAILILKRRRQ